MNVEISNKGEIGQINSTEKGSINAILNSNTDKVKKVDPNKHKNIWVSGSFYLFVFVIVISSIVVIAKILPFKFLPFIIIGSMLLFSIIGAFQLRNDDKLSPKSFLELMGLTFKNIPSLWKKD